MKAIALIVAAGRGHRTGHYLPKQYLELAGKSVLRRAIEAFVDHPGIDGIAVVINENDVNLYEKTIGHHILLPWIAGGEDRQQSVRKGLEALVGQSPDVVLIHDAARPFVSHDLITRCLTSLAGSEAVVPALKITDSLKEIDGDAVIGTVDRETIVAAQTPQCFAFSAILAAHRAFAGEQVTDDIALAELAGIAPKTVDGDVTNFKITTSEDVTKAVQYVTKKLTDIRIGQGFDVHAFALNRELWLGGVKIPHEKGLKGHSDADVALHALTDAILGAIGAGDIGTHFPPSDAQWQGARSDIFLAHAAELVREAGGIINNIDLTIICEAPKINPFRNDMRMQIAKILGIAEDRVSVKGTTTEKLGFAGRGEGIAAQAIATIRLPE
ncbi:MAG: bifunctional 2-C-methyl-D-erythritol 4-phosphate cytidylyltransferase/2-C-methyl-D-erythritol 2,4-cyclodiphosphate synthase [Sneathiella sp.]|nr:MAG: bifunctional 2-C-methyl-D-erythritol 4-phosphate cytidylyltransferase/2-C-methyl-D-erythritol 2,4-cyclodiphosphate synthase [Sneathiella sp.]